MVSTGSYVVNTTVDSTQVGQLKVGDQATVTVSGSTTPIYGTVGSIGLLASTSSGVASFPVVIDVTGSPSGVYGGSSATLSIITEELQDVIVVPTTAIHYSGDSTTVTLDADGQKVTRTVVIGATSGGDTQVTSGLAVGDKVYVTAGHLPWRHRCSRWPVRTVRRHGRRSLRRRRFRRCGGGFGGGGGVSADDGVPRDRPRGPSDRSGVPDAGVLTDTAPVWLEPTGQHPLVRPRVIEVREVRKTYSTGALEVEALRGVSFAIDAGEYVAVMGPSGSGKSTLMHILGCLDVPTSGSFRLAGEDVSTMSEEDLAHVRNRRIGFVFQQFNLLASLSAGRNVELPLVYAGVDRQARRERAEAALGRVGLADRIEHRPGELSGGQQQRVAMARALVTDPALILADEPTGNLDSVSAREVLDLLDELHRNGRTIVLITHDADVARSAGRTMRIRDGQVFDAVAAAGGRTSDERAGDFPHRRRGRGHPPAPIHPHRPGHHDRDRRRCAHRRIG